MPGKNDIDNECLWYFVPYAFGVCVAGYNQSFLEGFLNDINKK